MLRIELLACGERVLLRLLMRLRRVRDEEGNEDKTENMIKGATLEED